MALVSLLLIGAAFAPKATDDLEAKISGLQAQVEILKVDQARQEAEINAIKKSQTMAIMINQDLDARLSVVEGRKTK